MARIIVVVAAFLLALIPGSYDIEPFTPWHGWAAFMVNGDMTLGMGWGKTAEEAEEEARINCRRKSLTCAEQAALTSRAGDRAAHVCCESPGRACVVAFAPSKEEAVSNAEAFAELQEWGHCTLRSVYSARTGLQILSLE